MGEGGGVGVVQAPPARSGGGVVGAAEGVRRGSSMHHGSSHLAQNERPARAREKNRVRVVRAAAKGAGTAADAISSGPPPWGSAGGDVRAREAGIGPGRGTHLVERQKVDCLEEAAPVKGGGGEGRGW